MICNMDSKASGSKKGGRPPGSVKLLANDTWRYLYVLTQTSIDSAGAIDGPSEQCLCEQFAQFKVGRPAKVGEVVNGVVVSNHFQESWQKGVPFQTVHRQWDGMPEHNRAYFRAREPGPSWRDKKASRSTGDDLRRRLRLWR